MNSLSASNSMSPKDRARFGAAVAKDIAFDAVYSLWRRRRAEKWTQKRAAENIGSDEGWFCKQFSGPRNWTMETFGALVQALDGDAQIIVRPIEDAAINNGNYDAYAEMDDLKARAPSPNPNAPTPEPKGTKGTIEIPPSQVRISTGFVFQMDK